MPRKRGGKSVVETSSIAALERLLELRRLEAESLVARRKALQAELAQVDADLRATQGGGERAKPAAPAAAVRRVGRPRKVVSNRRRRGAESLNAIIAEVLRAATGPMGSAAVSEAVQARGYTSTAADFRHMVGKRLGTHPNAKRVATGKYVYREA